MSSEPIYYVYAYLDPITREPFYIGKGKDGRAYEHLISAKKTSNTLPKHYKIRKILSRGMSPVIIFPYSDLFEYEAFQKEASLIAHYGRRDMDTGCLLNMSDGGEGNSGHRYCEDPTEYKLTNIYTGEVVFKNRMQMREDLKIDRSSVCCLMKGRKRHACGWYLGDIPDDFQQNRLDPYEIHTLIHRTTLKEEKGTLDDLSLSTGLTGKQISSLVKGKMQSIHGWVYETLEGKNFKNHGHSYTIINIISKEIFTGTQAEIKNKIGSLNVAQLLDEKCIKMWVLGNEVSEETEIRFNKDKKFLLKNNKTGEERMLCVNELQDIGAKSRAFGVMRRKDTFKGWYRP